MAEVLIMALFIGVPAALLLAALGAVVYRRGESFEVDEASGPRTKPQSRAT